MHEYLLWALLLVALTVVLTVGVFHRKRFVDRGPVKGSAANPAKVRRQNPLDTEVGEWRT